MTHLDLHAGSLGSPNNLELARDLGTVILVFGLIYVFYRISGIQGGKALEAMDEVFWPPRSDVSFAPKKSFRSYSCWFS